MEGEHRQGTGDRLLGWGLASPRAGRPDPPPADSTVSPAQRLRAHELALAAGPFEWADIAWDLCDAGEPHVAAAFWDAVLVLYDCDARVHLHHADALDAAGDLEGALAAAARGHALEPSVYEFQEVILDLLFALGRSENDFGWQTPPAVVRLGRTTRDRVALHLAEEGECDLFDLRYTLFDGQYVCFDVEELALDLECDTRFDVCRFERAAFVSLTDPAPRADAAARSR